MRVANELPAAGSVRPLIVRFGALGDMIMLLPLVHALYERFGAPVDVVSSGNWNRVLLHGRHEVGTLYLIRSRKMPFLLSTDQWRLVRALRERGPSPIWDCDSDERTRSLLARAGVPPSCVVDTGLHERLPGEHEVDRWLRLAAMTPPACERQYGSARIEQTRNVPHLRVTHEQRLDLDAWLAAKGLRDRPLVLVQPGNKRTTKWWRPHDRASNTKYWPETLWGKTIDALAAIEPRAEFLLCGVPAESRLNRSILRCVHTERARDVAGELPLSRLLALQERATGMISVDTGPAHSAAALGCPLVVLFGRADPSTYLPRSASGAVKYVRGIEDGQPSMRAIRIEAVVGAWNALPRR